jgi:hypothetical protein
LTDDDFDLLVDHDQQLASQVRQAYAQELEGSNIPVAGGHFRACNSAASLPARRSTLELRRRVIYERAK